MEDIEHKTLKIKADKNISYEAVMKLVAITKEMDWKSILAFKN